MKQHNIVWLGPLVDSLFNALPIVSIVMTTVNFIQLAIVLYTSAKPYLVEWGLAWMDLRLFLLLMIAAMAINVAVMVLLVYKFVLRPLWLFRAGQMFDGDSKGANPSDLQRFVSTCKDAGLEVTIKAKGDSNEKTDCITPGV